MKGAQRCTRTVHRPKPRSTGLNVQSTSSMCSKFESHSKGRLRLHIPVLHKLLHWTLYVCWLSPRQCSRHCTVWYLHVYRVYPAGSKCHDTVTGICRTGNWRAGIWRTVIWRTVKWKSNATEIWPCYDQITWKTYTSGATETCGKHEQSQPQSRYGYLSRSERR